MRIAVVLLFAALLAGCGGHGDSTTLEKAADEAGSGTSRYEIGYRVGDEFAIDLTGVFDFANETGAMTISNGGSDALQVGVPAEVRFLEDTAYIRWVVKGKSHWVKEMQEPPAGDPFELLVPLPGGASNPTDVLPLVLRSAEQIQTVGKEEIRGTETTHYRARVNIRKLIEQLPVEKRPRDDVEVVWGKRIVPVEVWIDDESRVRRIRIKEEMDQSHPVRMTAEFFDFGVEVDVEPPATDELISQDELDRLTGNDDATGQVLVPCKDAVDPKQCAQLEKEKNVGD